MISVIVCTYNRCECLKNALGSLARVCPPGGESWELIVVDNNSNDGTAETVKAFAGAQQFDVVYLFESRQGLSYARNSGLRAARGDIVAFTDDDVTVEPEWLRGLLEAFARFDCAGVGGRIIPVWKTQKPSWFESKGEQSFNYGAIVSFDRGEEACELTGPLFGANMAFKKAAFERFGDFRTDLGKCGNDGMIGEETEFCYRLFARGQKLAYAPQAIVRHPAPVGNVKEHFQRHYASCGRVTARLNGLPQDVICWFGIPRYMIGTLIRDAWKWLSCFGSERFQRKLQTCDSFGVVYEAYRMSQENRNGKIRGLVAHRE